MTSAELKARIEHNLAMLEQWQAQLQALVDAVDGVAFDEQQQRAADKLPEYGEGEFSHVAHLTESLT